MFGVAPSVVVILPRLIVAFTPSDTSSKQTAEAIHDLMSAHAQC